MADIKVISKKYNLLIAINSEMTSTCMYMQKSGETKQLLPQLLMICKNYNKDLVYFQEKR